MKEFCGTISYFKNCINYYFISSCSVGVLLHSLKSGNSTLVKENVNSTVLNTATSRSASIGSLITFNSTYILCHIVIFL